MKVRLTPRAVRRAAIVATWWRVNRPAARDLFELELEQAKQKLVNEPALGASYQTVRGRVLRRLLLPKSEQHVYYSIDDATQTVVIYTIWGGRRGRGPKL